MCVFCFVLFSVFFFFFFQGKEEVVMQVPLNICRVNMEFIFKKQRIEGETRNAFLLFFHLFLYFFIYIFLIDMLGRGMQQDFCANI